MEKEKLENESNIKNDSNQLSENQNFIVTENDEKLFIVKDDKRELSDKAHQLIEDFKKETADYDTFIRTWQKNGDKAAAQLLKLQSNKFPAKEGGLDIGYSADILYDHMTNQMTNNQVLVWEAFGAAVSSRPEDEFYIITPEDLIPYVDFKDKRSLYNAFNDGAEKLKQMNLTFDIPDTENEKKDLTIPWQYGFIHVNGTRKDGTLTQAYVKIFPYGFCRALMISSGVLHGAHWNRRIAKGLIGDARKLYIFCARNKNYAKYKGAPIGVKELTPELTKYELGFEEKKGKKKWDNNYLTRKIKRAVTAINKTPDSEFCVVVETFTEKKEFKYRFTIQENNKLRGNLSYSSTEKKAEYLKDNIESKNDYNNEETTEEKWNNYYEQNKEIFDQFFKDTKFTKESISKLPARRRMEYFLKWKTDNGVSFKTRNEEKKEDPEDKRKRLLEQLDSMKQESAE